LGTGDTITRNIPEQIRSLNGVRIIDIAVGSAQTICLSDDGSIYVWGYNGRGELGLGDQTDRHLPNLMLSNFSEAKLFAYACSRNFFIKTKDRVYAWGVNSNGQLGLGDNRDRDRPEEVVSLREQIKIYDEIHFVIGYCSVYVLFALDHAMATKTYTMLVRGSLVDTDFHFDEKSDGEPPQKRWKQGN
jgi:alpha-tubulin suppressor-like RCC1 family protein